MYFDKQNMQIYFGSPDTEDLDLLDDEELFQPEDGNFYFYKLVLQEDQICLYDTCNRHFPVDLDSVKALSSVIVAAEMMVDTKNHIEKKQRRLTNTIERIIETYNQYL